MYSSIFFNQAYRKWVELQGKEEATLPGINLSNNQLFFTAFAQVWLKDTKIHRTENK